ncbi:STAS domain-containing protein [Dactylosporangium sp. CA-139066]|uniref:STAS domain-containing protein n=1 Tax=Dactylosporangium sp. CA-139066 TaxID=3239930 RepID=UPI003D8AD97B
MHPAERHRPRPAVRGPRQQTLQYRIENRGDAAVLVLAGVLDLAGRERFGAAVAQLLHPPRASGIEIDVAERCLMSADGIALLYQARSEAHDVGVTLAVSNAQGLVRTVLRIVNALQDLTTP